jgi:glycosyltransferase involved in cell wall biosynthesis
VTQPRVSVVITTYNTGRYLPETLESVFAQTYPSFEVIVVDDGSTDDSVARARAFGDRVRVLTRPHEGLGPARNAGAAEATGEYLAFLDSDDLWVPDALAVQVAQAEAHPESGLIVADGLAFGDGSVDDHRIGRPLFGPQTEELFGDAHQVETTGRYHRAFTVGNRIACPAQTLLPRRVYDAVGPVCITPNGAQDYDYYLRIARTFAITFHRARLARWRVRSDSMSGTPDQRALRIASQALEVVARERREAPPEARADVDAAYRSHVRRATGAARDSLFGDQPADPDDLAAVYRVAGRDPNVLATRAILALPRPLARSVCRGLRRLATSNARRRGAPDVRPPA